MAEINVSGTWAITLQSPTFTVIDVNIVQDDTKLSGSFVVQDNDFTLRGKDRIFGVLNGKIEGNNLLMNLIYSEGYTEEYSGTFNLNGRLTGFMVYLSSYMSTTWASDKVFNP